MRIGYYLSDKKKKSINWDSFLDFVKDKPIKLIEINSPSYLENETEPYDVLLLRLTEDLVENNETIINSFTKYLQDNPKIRVIDSISGQITISDRQLMINAIKNLNLCVPKSICMNFTEKIPSDFQYPIICKHKDAVAGSNSHIMDVICNEKSLNALYEEKHKTNESYIFQEYINHSGTIFKVYVIGSYIDVQRRVSFPDFPFEGQNPDIPFNFNSQKWKHELPKHLTMATTGKADLPSMEYIRTMTDCLKKQLGLSLFGFDIITNSKTGENTIIDINFMPGFVNVPNFNEMLYDHMISK